MGKDREQLDRFALQGQFLGFAARPGDYKFKYLRLANETGEWLIKVDKELRLSLWHSLAPGTWVEVGGWQKTCLSTGNIKLKADTVLPQPAQPCRDEQWTLPPQDKAPEKRSTTQETILVCQKSDCCRRGGQQVMAALQQGLEERGLGDRITVRGTGCMKQCKSGPHVVMPDKTRYRQVSAEEVSQVLESYLSVKV